MRVIILLNLVPVIFGVAIRQCLCGPYEECLKNATHEPVDKCFSKCEKFFPTFTFVSCMKQFLSEFNRFKSCSYSFKNGFRGCTSQKSNVLVERSMEEFRDIMISTIERKLDSTDIGRTFLNAKAARQAECLFECVYPGRNECTRKLKCDILLPPEDVFFRSFNMCAEKRKLMSRADQIYTCICEAEAEASYSEKLQSIINTFSQSRLDLPLKKISEIAKVHGKAAHHLRKFMDIKKNDHLNLWKFCNIYSCCAVELDRAMRETRCTLKSQMTIDGTLGKSKRKNLFNTILSHSIKTTDSTAASHEKTGKEHGWFSKLSTADKNNDLRCSQKNNSPVVPTGTDEKAIIQMAKTPRPNLDYSKQTPDCGTVVAKNENTSNNSLRPENIVTGELYSFRSPGDLYATPIYGDLQKASIVSNNKSIHPCEIHQTNLRTDVLQRSEEQNKISAIKILTKVDVTAENDQNNGTSLFVADIAPTYVTIESFTPTPIPSPRIHSIKNLPVSSSSERSSLYSSSSNITSFAVNEANVSPVKK